MSDRLHGKVFLISGAASGLGEATAHRFSKEGGIVFIGARNKIQGKKVTEQIKKSGHEAFYIELDVTDENSWIQAINEIKTQFKKLDILVNNAGLGLSGPITSLTLEAWHNVMKVNLDGVFLGIKHAIPLMELSGHGSIINIASIDGINGVPDASAYCASKAGVLGLSRAVAIECAEKGNQIRINAFCPGSLHSPMVEKAESWSMRVSNLGLENAINARAQHIPFKRLATYDELVNGILFLASDESSYMTGSELIIDGGITAR